MRKILSILLILLSFQVFGTNYYVSNSGSDSNDGLTTSTPWQTLSKTHYYPFLAGDSILLKMGDRWDERLIIDTDSTNYNVYGEGDRPVVDGVWMNVRNNISIWNIYSESGDNYYPFLIQGSNNIHIFRCVADGQNDGTCPVGMFIAWGASHDPYHDIIVEECEVFDNGNIIKQWYGGGIKLDEYGYDCQVINNIVHNNIETNIQAYTPYTSETWMHDIVISGNTIYNPLPNDNNYETGINLGWNCYDIIVEKNVITDCNVSIQVDAKTHNNTVRNNLIIHPGYVGIRLLANQYGNNANNDVFNNTIIGNENTDYGISVRAVSNSSSTGNEIKNNIIYGTRQYYYPFKIEDGGNDEIITLESDYNCYYSEISMEFINRSELYSDFSTWKTVTGLDSNSIITNPYIDSLGYISGASSCINAGIIIDTVKYDINGISRPQGSAYDIGSYEVSPNIYVSNNGNDDWAGTELQPFLTISHAISVADEGSCIYLNRGDTFTESITVSTDFITIDAYGIGDNPIISGFYSIPSFLDQGDNIWKATTVSTLDNINILSINGINTPIGTFPDLTSDPLYYVNSTDTVVISDFYGDTNDWAGALWAGRTGFLLRKEVILNQSDDTLFINNSIESTNSGWTSVIMDDIRTLSTSGEWYYDNSLGDLYVYSDGEPQNVKIPIINNLITLSSNNFTIRNITIEGANEIAFKGADIYPNFCSNIIIDSVNFLNIGINAIYGYFSNLSITNCVFDEINTLAVDCERSNNITIRNNTFRDIGYVAVMNQDNSISSPAGTAIKFGGWNGYNDTIQYNRFYNIGYIAVSFYADTILIEKNYVDSFCVAFNDGGAFYTFTNTAPNSVEQKINNNIIINGLGGDSWGLINGTTRYDYTAGGIYLDNNSGNVEITNNTIKNGAKRPVTLKAEHIVKFNNNIVYGGGENNYGLVWFFPYGDTIPIGSEFYNNILVTNDTTVAFVYGFYTASTTIESEFKSDSNVYINNNTPIKNFFTEMSLSEWQTETSLDANSISLLNANTSLRMNTSFTESIDLSNDSIYTFVDGSTQIGGTILPMSSEVFINVSKYTQPQINSILGGYYGGYINAGYYGGSIIGTKQ